MMDMTIAEIARSLARLEASQGEQCEKLDEIKTQTTKTNGTLLWHDKRLTDLELKRTSDRGDVITLSIPAGVIGTKKVAAIIGGVLAGLIAAWKAGLLS